MEWFRWEAWLAAAFVLGLLEMLSMDLILIMLAIGAVAGMIAALVGIPEAAQVLVAAGTSVAMLALVRPSLTKHLKSGPELRLGHGKLVGKQGLVTETITALNPGRVRLAGDVWSAEPYDESLTIEAGETVEVFEIRGATAYVHPIPRLDH